MDTLVEKKKNHLTSKAHIPLVIIKYYNQNENLKDDPAVLNLFKKGN